MARALTSTCGHLLFDAEERAEFMRERFEEKIASTQKLFEAASKTEQEVGEAVEQFRRSSAHEQEVETGAKRKPAISTGKLKPVPKPGGAVGGQVSANKLKKVKVSSRRLEPAPDTPASIKKEEEYAATEAQVRVTAPPPRSASMIWPVLAVIFALGVGLLVWKAMQGGTSTVNDRPHVTDPVTVTPIPGGDDERVGEIPGTDTLDPTPVKGNPPPKADPTVKNDPTPRAPKEKGEVTLVLIPEATVMKGGTVLGKGTMMTFPMTVGTHLVTVTGADGVRRALSLQVGAGKNKAQKYRLDDLPPQ
jgi:hypothetical protein